jgi:hypothetical protein
LCWIFFPILIWFRNVGWTKGWVKLYFHDKVNKQRDSENLILLSLRFYFGKWWPRLLCQMQKKWKVRLVQCEWCVL